MRPTWGVAVCARTTERQKGSTASRLSSNPHTKPLSVDLRPLLAKMRPTWEVVLCARTNLGTTEAVQQPTNSASRLSVFKNLSSAQLPRGSRVQFPLALRGASYVYLLQVSPGNVFGGSAVSVRGWTLVLCTTDTNSTSSECTKARYSDIFSIPLLRLQIR